MMQFAKEGLLVLTIVLAIVLGLLLWKVGPKGLRAYFSTKEGKGILKGIVLSPIVIGIIAVVLALGGWLLSGKAHAEGLDLSSRVHGTFFNDASVFMGIDRTRGTSPQCWEGGVDNRSTSNLGARLNVWQNPSGNVRLNAKYTHHSCALNRDRNGYDALGIELEWYVWRR